MFRLRLDRTAAETLVQQTREQIVSALHLGQIRAGDRLPSVRSLSRAWGIDPKTAFRIYHALEREGYVRLKPGSGAYVQEVSSTLLEQAHALGLLQMIRRHTAAAEQMQVDAERYNELVSRYTRSRAGRMERRERLGVIECNAEQLGLYREELGRRCRVRTIAMPLASVLRSDAAVLAAARSCRYLVTTDYHYAQVEPFARKVGRRPLCVRLDPDFIQGLLDLARRGVLGMIVSDTAYLPAFRKSIMALGLDPQAARRIEAAAWTAPGRVRALIARADSLYVSPLCGPAILRLIPPSMRVLRPAIHLSTESVESIEALLLFGESVDGTEPPRGGDALDRAAGGPDEIRGGDEGVGGADLAVPDPESEESER